MNRVIVNHEFTRHSIVGTLKLKQTSKQTTKPLQDYVVLFQSCHVIIIIIIVWK